MSESDTTVLTIAELHRRVEAILRRAGLNAAQAGALARVIVAGERDACKSHGIYRIEGILRTVKAGKVNPQAVPELLPQEASAIVRADARAGFANAAVELGAPVLAERARGLGLAALVVNDCTHFSALWPEVELLTGDGACRAGHVPELCHRRPDRRQQAAARHQSLRLRLAASGPAALRLRLRHLGHGARRGRAAPPGRQAAARGLGDRRRRPRPRPIRRRRWPERCCPSAATRARRSAP